MGGLERPPKPVVQYWRVAGCEQGGMGESQALMQIHTEEKKIPDRGKVRLDPGCYTVKKRMNADSQGPAHWLLLPTCRVDLPYTVEFI